MTADHSTLGVCTRGRVLEIRLARPDRLNAINRRMRAELRQLVAQAAADDGVGVLLLTGEGRGFCVGQDLEERRPLPDGRRHDLSLALDREYNPLFRDLAALAKPLVCAVNGVAAGAGVSLALAADVTFAASSARFLLSFANLGLGPDCGASWLLPRLVGPQRAAAIAMSGDPVGAADAERWGMIWRAVADEQLLPAARDFAARLATRAPLALAATRAALRAGWGLDLSAQLDLERDQQQRLGYSDDYAEGLAAFREKRPAVFRGR